MKGVPSPQAKALADARDRTQRRLGYITTEDAAKLAGRPIATIYAWKRNGWLPDHRIVAGKVYIRRRQLLVHAKNMNGG